MLKTSPHDDKPKGKIVVTYAINDEALGGSNVFNIADANRLGRTSAGGYYKGGWWWTAAEDKWGRDDNKYIHHDEFKDHIESVHVIHFSGNYDDLAHTYHLGKEMAEVYDKKLL